MMKSSLSRHRLCQHLHHLHQFSSVWADQKSTISTTTTTSASTTSDAQINSKIIIANADQTADSCVNAVLQKINAVPAPAMVQAAEHSPVAGESKQCNSPQIIRKSMFNFVIKLGSAAGDNGAGQYPTACRH
jgi:hypothetical protein